MNRILICEKNEFFLSTLHSMIKNYFPNLSLKLVLTQEECLAVTDIFKPDILILGSNLYSGSDLKILKELRRSHPGVNIIVFTDYDIEEYRKEAILKGANHTISKEVWTGNEILSLLNTILTTRECQLQRQQEISAGESAFLQQPLERRRKDQRGRIIERAYLAQNPDRRNLNTE